MDKPQIRMSCNAKAADRQSAWIPLSEPDIRGRENAYLNTCIEDGWVSSAGPFVTQLESAFAALSGREFGVSTCSGTAALHLCLVTLGIGRKSRVIVPDWTFAATANAVIHAGASPVFTDIEAATLTLNADLVERLAGDGGIDAVIAVDVLGHICDMDRLVDICDRHAIPLISDAAGSIGATYKGLPAGNSGAAAVFSLNGNKVVTGGCGGMIVTDDPAFAENARHLSTQARSGSEYVHDAVGYNVRLSNLNAAVALAQLERLEEMVARRRNIAAIFTDVAKQHPHLRPLPCAEWSQSNGWLFSVMVDTEENAASLISHFSSKSIQARTFWRSLSHQSPYSSYETVLDGMSRSMSGRVVSLPSNSTLNDDGVDRITEALWGWEPENAQRK